MAKKQINEAVGNLFGEGQIHPVSDDNRPYLFINFNTHGNLGKTTEEKRFLEFYFALMGIYPVIISADPTEPKVMRQNYGQRDSNNLLLPEDEQQLGVGVVEIDMEDKDGKLANLLREAYDMNRDVLVDTKGGSLDSFANNWEGIVSFFNNFSNIFKIIWLVPFVDDYTKDEGNLNKQHQYLTNDINNNQLYADIDMIYIFSQGKMGSEKQSQHIQGLVAQWEQANPYPTDTKTIKAVFKSDWSKMEEINELFRDKEIRVLANQKIPDNSKLLAESFLNEGDAFWAKTLLTQEQLEEIAFRPHPIPLPRGRTRLWGKTLFSRDEIQDIADSKQDPAEKQKWIDLNNS